MSEAPAPDIVVIVHRVSIGRPLDLTWARIGRFADLGRFLDVTCVLQAGYGGIGSVRLINDAVIERMVGESRHSYTYAQTRGPMSGHAYHGCVACEADGPDATVLTYTLVYDQAGIDPDRRGPEGVRLSERFAGAVGAMRQIAEG